MHIVLITGKFRAECNAVLGLVDVSSAADSDRLALFAGDAFLNVKKRFDEAAFRRNVVRFALHNGFSAYADSLCRIFKL